MRKRLRTKRRLYVLHALLFIVFALAFWLENDHFFGSILFFSAMVNMVAYRQVPLRIASITVLLNLFNACIGSTLTYYYLIDKANILMGLWFFISLAYLFAALRQIVNLINYKHKMRKKAKNSADL